MLLHQLYIERYCSIFVLWLQPLGNLRIKSSRLWNNYCHAFFFFSFQPDHPDRLREERGEFQAKSHANPAWTGCSWCPVVRRWNGQMGLTLSNQPSDYCVHICTKKTVPPHYYRDPPSPHHPGSSCWTQQVHQVLSARLQWDEARWTVFT